MNFFKRIFPILLGSVTLFSCTKKFQEINTDPSKPATTNIGPLINQVFSTLFLLGQEQASADNDWLYPVTQLGGITSSSGYVLANASKDIWNDYFSTLQNINAVQDMIDKTADTESMNNIQAILYVLKSYKTLRVSDEMGDIPYFDAGKAYTNNIQYFRPKFDNQKDVYLDCLKNLEWASKNIVTDPNAKTKQGNAYAGLGSFDTFFGGDMMQWLRFTNSLRLRYAMQMVEKDPGDAEPIIKDVISNDLPLVIDGLDNKGDVGMWPAQLNNFQDWVRFWSFYSHKFERITTTFWNLVANGRDETDIFDPRALIFAETNQAGEWAPYRIGSSVSDPTNPYKQERTTDYNDKDNCIFSPFNFHLVSDEYYIPEVIFSAAEVHFLKAEAYARGLGIAKDMSQAENEYYAGISSSVNFWYEIAHHTNTTDNNWQASAPPMPTDAQMKSFLANPKVVFTGSEDQKLNKIYAQEWLSFFRQPWLAFNLWRRTGRTPRDPNANTSQYDSFYRIPYPNDESINNSDNFQAQLDKMGGNGTNIKVWWMK